MSLLNKLEASSDLSPTQLRRLRDAKIVKYQWVPEILARMLVGRLPTNAQIEFDDLYSAGIIELTKQMDRIYSDPKLIKRLWNSKKNDLTVGPFFLKGLKNPYIQKSDSASLKFIKGAILDEMRKLDPATPRERSKLKKINKFIHDYRNTLGRTPRKRVISEKFNISIEEIDDLLMIEGRE